MFGQIKLYKQVLVGFVVAVLVATTLIPVASAATGFSDVSSASSHAENIERAVEMGLIKGQNGKFHPNDAITRGQFWPAIWKISMGRKVLRKSSLLPM